MNHGEIFLGAFALFEFIVILAMGFFIYQETK